MKKKILILAVVLVSSGFLWADGFGLNSWATLDTSDGTNITDFVLDIRPYYSTMLDDSMELAPYLLFTMDNRWVNGGINNERYSIGAGTGVYFHFLQGKLIDLSTGADLGVSFTWDPDITPFFGIGLNVGVPVVLDVKLSESFLIRITQTIGQLSFDYTNNNGTTTTSSALDTFWTVLGPSFGFMFLF